MKLSSFWTRLVYFFDVVTFQTTDFGDQRSLQTPFGPASNDAGHGHIHSHVDTEDVKVMKWNDVEDDGRSYILADGNPIIPIPKNDQEGPKGIACEYQMPGWKNCNGPNSRDCWLSKDGPNGKEYKNLETNYEDPSAIPVGTTRKFYLEVGEEPIRPDRVTMEHGKVFNRTYPGPWIEACWGDWIEVTVKNGLRWNGTSIHWHGFRQLKTSHEDGVNGVTECPIAPGDTYTYRFRAMQYGSAWYHSHYGLQYGDGLLGPITIYGPSSANFDSDSSFRPILMTDWNHRSVFQDWPVMLTSDKAPEMTNILLNGTGQFGPDSRVKDKYQLYFQPGKKHKLILINTSVDTTFIFSIDNHNLTVMEMDFVPIKPYNTSNLRIGIGQRYHIVVEGVADPYNKTRDGNYWMRTTPARYCNKFAYGPDTATGIIRYDPQMSRDTAPRSEPEIPDNLHCGDEDRSKLVPILEWTIGDPANIDSRVKHDDLPMNKKYIFDVGMVKSSGDPYRPADELSRWNLHDKPFRINFSEPTILNLDKTDEYVRDRPHLDIIDYGLEVEDRWVWMIFTAPSLAPVHGRGRSFFPAAHPMHLHGHDFAILYQSEEHWPDYKDKHKNKTVTGWNQYFTPDKLNCNNRLINCTNPARRDVVLLPAGGFVIIAFKADNPGAWIVHCHIAFHASSGLAMQIIENKHLIENTMKKDRPAIEKRCKNWNDWFNNPMNHWNYTHPDDFQDDSGV